MPDEPPKEVPEGGASELRGPAASFTCAACGNNASTVVLVLPGEIDPNVLAGKADPNQPLDLETLFTDVYRLAIRGGPVTVTHHLFGVDPAPLMAALAAADASALYKINLEYTPFWCPTCDASYCREHYEHWTEYDGIFFDCIRGSCPRGHERMLLD